MTHTRNRHLAGAVLALALIVAALPVAAFPSQTALAAQPEVYINEIQV